ncbi:hypothetical protein [Mucilaginibacter sp. dw_454]|uniref:hypothetical protein n=1 Tax=Mucilaginibacter sp. dw_454 TaxID=2720079 RepID=UPI001BD56656|nr:hypothetical protein [Mucilaginibacter sp. dw_454]
MRLSTEEIIWIKERMQIYVIKYQEIYDEILDHILTAIEERRSAGDERAIDILFQNVVDDDFSGYVGIESLAEEEEKLYHKKIRKIFYDNLKEQFNWKTLLIAVVLLAIAFQLPNVRLVNRIFASAIFLMAITPILVVFLSLYGKIGTMKGKHSLIKKYLMAQMMVPMTLFNSVIYLPMIVTELMGEDDNFKIIKHLPPVVMMTILVFFMMINSSYIQSSRRLIAQTVNRIS